MTHAMPEHTPRDNPHTGRAPGGTLIDRLDGDPEGVQTRGQQIVDLGSDMAASWTLLRRLVDDGAAMESLTIERLREVAGEVGDDLDKAAKLYDAVGPVILHYGRALATAQPKIDALVADLEELWRQYHALREDADTAQDDADAAARNVPHKPDPGAPAFREMPTLPVGRSPYEAAKSQYDKASADSAAASAAAAAARKLADDMRDEWEQKAARYDEAWDSWHDAFEQAAENIKEGFAGKIEDSFSDDLRDFLGKLYDVLAVAGIVLGVLAILVGGPLVLALAGIVAVLTLAVALTRKLAFDDGSWLDVAFAAVGVIPFLGPAVRGGGGLFSAAGRAGLKTAWIDDFARYARFQPLHPLQSLRGLSGLSGATFADKTADFIARLFAGKPASHWLTPVMSGKDAARVVGAVWTQQAILVDWARTVGAGIGATAQPRNPLLPETSRP